MRGFQGGFLLGGLVMLAACSSAEDNAPQALPVKAMSLGGQSLKVQIADDDAEREKGLMFVKAMAPDAGMLFVWPQAQERSFWMRNTFIPLDLLFLRAGKVVSVVPWAKPFDETALPSGEPADMVLEVNGGWAMAHNVNVGSEMSLK